MKPSARIQAVIDILQRASSAKIPLDAVVGDYMRGRRYIGSKDRAFIAENVYGMERARARLGWWLDKAGAPDMARTRMIAWLALTGTQNAGALFDGTAHAPEVRDDSEKALATFLDGKSLDDPAMPDDVRVECPTTYAETLRALYGAEFAAEMGAMMAGATLDLRVNTRLASREDVQELLKKDGVETVPTPYSPWGLRATAKIYLADTKAFKKGWVDIQDEGSQMIALACNVAPGMQVLDFCAGGGGKTLALAAAMQVKGRIVATDTETARLEKGRQRFRRAHVSDIIEVRPLSDEKNRKWLRRQKETFDVVLTDVPCSGTGTWRRNPDMRWRSYGPSLDELLIVQADIIDRAAKAVKPGGRLVYATCSLLPQENEKQIAAFLDRSPEFEIAPMPTDIPGPGPFMRLSPLHHKTDGFFAAALRRKQA